MCSLKKINNGLDAAEKGANLLLKIFAPFVVQRNEAIAHVTEAAKAMADLGLTQEEALAIILNAPTIVREAKNKQAIYEKAKEKFLDGKTLNNNIDIDWLTFYFNQAKNVTNTDVQEIWGRLLAAEFNDNGTIPKRLIETLSYLDNDTAAAFTNLCRLTFLAPGEKNGQKEYTKTPFIIPFHWVQIQACKIDPSLEEIQNYGEKACMKGSTLPYSEYCQTIPNIEKLLILDELSLIRLHEKAPGASFMRQYSCTKKDEPTALNEFECNGQRYQLRCQTARACGEPHHIEVGYVEYTAMGKRLFEIIDENPIASLEELIIGHYKGSKSSEEYLQVIKL